MESKAEKNDLTAVFRAYSDLLMTSPKDDEGKKKRATDLRAAKKAVDDFIRAKKEETRRLRDQVRLIRGIKSFNRLAKKLGREEIPVPKLM